MLKNGIVERIIVGGCLGQFMHGNFHIASANERPPMLRRRGDFAFHAPG